jgi:hypothetical protein
MNYFFDTFLARQRKVTRPPGRIPGTGRRTNQRQHKPETQDGSGDGGFQPALPSCAPDELWIPTVGRCEG